MNLLLDSTTITWAFFALVGGIVALIIFLRYWYQQLSQKQDFDKGNSTILTRNKYAEVNVFKWNGTFLRVGMVASLAFVFLAFNYTTFEEKKFEGAIIEIEDIFLELPPRTKDRKPPPPPPPPPPPVKIELPDEPIEDTIDFVDQSIDAEEEIIADPLPETEVTKAPEPILPPPDEEIEVEELRIFAEQMPRFPGCETIDGDKIAKDKCATNALLKFLSSKLNYPALARENDIQGTAVIRFVVETDGRLSNMEIVRDPGGGLGKEALRVVRLMNGMPENWTPGKQNARPVRVQFNLPVKFQLH